VRFGAHSLILVVAISGELWIYEVNISCDESLIIFSVGNLNSMPVIRCHK